MDKERNAQLKFGIFIQVAVKMKMDEGMTEKEAWVAVLKKEGMSNEQIQEVTKNLT